MLRPLTSYHDVSVSLCFSALQFLIIYLFIDITLLVAMLNII